MNIQEYSKCFFLYLVNECPRTFFKHFINSRNYSLKKLIVLISNTLNIIIFIKNYYLKILSHGHWLTFFLWENIVRKKIEEEYSKSKKSGLVKKIE